MPELMSDGTQTKPSVTIILGSMRLTISFNIGSDVLLLFKIYSKKFSLIFFIFSIGDNEFNTPVFTKT
jgi:hypothetical protein